MTKRFKVLSLLVILVGGMQAPTLSGVEKTWFTKRFVACIAAFSLAGLTAYLCRGPIAAWWDRYDIRLAVKRGHYAATEYISEMPGTEIDFPDVAKLITLDRRTLNNVVLPKHLTTALHLAAKRGNLKLVRLLIQRGADINQKDASGWMPIHYACVYGHLNIVKYLIELKSPIDTFDIEGRTPLNLAAGKGHLEIVQYLVQHGAQINASDGVYSWTPLHIAARWGRLDVVKYLVEHGASDRKAARDEAFYQEKQAVADYLDLVEDLCSMTPKKTLENPKDPVLKDKKQAVKKVEKRVVLTPPDFVQKYLSTQALINKNLTDIIRLAHSKFEIFEKLFFDKVSSQKNIQFKAFGSSLCAKNIGENAWYLFLLRLATISNNVVLAQHIIANKPELWDIVDKVFFKETLPELTDKELESETTGFKIALTKADKEEFKKPFFRFMKTKAYLDGNHQDFEGKNPKKTVSQWPLPREVSAEILQFRGPFDGKTVKE